MLMLKVLTNGGSVMLGYGLVKVSSRVAHIIHVTRIIFNNVIKLEIDLMLNQCYRN